MTARAISRRSATTAFPNGYQPLARDSSFRTRLDAGHTVALDDPIAAARFAAEEVELWRDAGIYYFVPCVFEGGAIAVLALGRKDNDEPFNSEDLALLTAVAGQVATAIENGRLYRQLHLKAEELGRMREFNENILESLDDGLAVFDLEERIVRWNRALEGFYGIDREDAIGRTLSEVFDQPFVRGARRRAPRASLRRHPVSRPAYDPAQGRQLAASGHRDGGAAAGFGQRRRCRGHSTDRGHHGSRPGSRNSCRFPRRWRRSAFWPPASRTKSTRR